MYMWNSDVNFSLTSSFNNFDFRSPFCKLILWKSVFARAAVIVSLSFVFFLCFVSSSSPNSVQGLFPVHAWIRHDFYVSLPNNYVFN